jgi:ankyrin repeat protein
VRQALVSLPQGLHDTYARIVQQIMEKPEYERSLGIRCLRWVLYAQRPLYVDELQYALATFDEGKNAKDFELDAMDFAFGARANLVVKERVSGRNVRDVVRPIHYSVQEYFAGGDQALHSPVIQLPLGNRMDCNARLAADCLAHISQPMMSFGKLEPIDDPGCRLTQDAFLHYAATFFDAHLIVGDPEIARHHTDKFLASSSGLFSSVLNIRVLGSKGHWLHYFDLGIQGDIIGGCDFESGIFATDTCTASSVVFVTDLRRLPEIERKYRCQEALNVALLHACRFKTTADVLRCLNDGADINCRDPHGHTPLHVVLSGSYRDERDEKALLLIERGADVMAQNHKGDYVPWEAALYCEPEVVLALLRAGKDVNRGNPLAQAARLGRLKYLRYFVEAGADINATEGEHGPALHAAMYWLKPEAITYLLDNGADVNLRHKVYGTALLIIIRMPERILANETFLLLRRRGARVDVEALLTAAKHLAICALSQILLELDEGPRYSVMDIQAALVAVRKGNENPYYREVAVQKGNKDREAKRVTTYLLTMRLSPSENE